MQNREAEIEAARAQYRPTPVKRGHFPRWFVRRWGRRFGKGTDILNQLRTFLRDNGAAIILDHYGSTTLPNGCLAFVTEPYIEHCDIEGALAIVAGELKCDYLVDDNSWHYPGETVRGAWFEGTDKTQPIDVIERRG
jgi:hypothetical protein